MLAVGNFTVFLNTNYMPERTFEVLQQSLNIENTTDTPMECMGLVSEIEPKYEQ